ncbi:hypothetical protein J8L73_17710 [Pseudoalteromonas sp. MMG006]|uniref:hypothetical protein n=1 Tax=Pseudoalteromonas sp. MMG006 TaxID=2822683 RepID=UPI001B381F98|nr:hypothetical protein [Pseudoalteromonas sp. MMG006]MBQ4800936.1 hypothetical protein [Pseudoalteromonas sp. MMG006]
MSKSSSETLVSRIEPFRAKFIEFISCIFKKLLVFVLWFLELRKWLRLLCLLVLAFVCIVVGFGLAENLISQESLPAINMVLEEPIFQNVRERLSLIQIIITTLLQASIPMFAAFGIASITFSYINKYFQEFVSKESDERKKVESTESCNELNSVVLDQDSLASNTERECSKCKKMEKELSGLKDKIGFLINDLTTVFMKFVGIGTFGLSLAMVTIGSLGLGAILGLKYKFAKMLNEAFQVNLDAFDFISLGSFFIILIGIFVLLMISFDRKKASKKAGFISLAIVITCQGYLFYGSISDLSTDCKLANQMLVYYYKLKATTGEVGNVPQIPLCGFEVTPE